MDKTINEVSCNAFQSMIRPILDFVKRSALTYAAVFVGDTAYKDGVAFLFLPPQISFDAVQSALLFKAMTTADECSMTVQKGLGYIRFIKRNIYDEGIAYPSGMEATAEIEDTEIEKYKDKLRSATVDLLGDLK